MTVKPLELVEFTSDTCKVCVLMKPMLDTLANEYERKLGYNILTIKDMKDNFAEASSMGINSYPTFVVYRKGKQVAVRVGSASIGQLRKMLNEATEGLELPKPKPEEAYQAEVCPECKDVLIRQEGCNVCMSCGYSKCG